MFFLNVWEWNLEEWMEFLEIWWVSFEMEKVFCIKFDNK